MTNQIRIDIPREWKEEIDRDINEARKKYNMNGKIPRVQFIRMNFRIVNISKELKNAGKKRKYN